MAIKRLLHFAGNILQRLDAAVFTDTITDAAGVNGQNVTAWRQIHCLGDPETLDNVVEIVAIHNSFALLVTDLPHNSDVFFGFGEHSFSGTKVNADVWGGPTDVQPEPDTSGYNLIFKSSSVADDTGGNGALKAEAHYLDTAGAQQIVEVTLNGQTEVDSGVTDCMFVNQMHVTELVGTGLVAAGDIDCLAGTGGDVVSRITLAGNQSMSTMKQVPAGKNLLVIGWHAYGTAATTKIANLRIRSSTNDGVLNAGVYHFHDSARVKDSSTGHLPLQFFCPPLSTVKVSGWTTGAIDVTARWSGWLENV